MNSAIKLFSISLIYWTIAIHIVITVRFVGLDFFIEKPLGVPLSEIYITNLPGCLIFGLLWGFIEIVDNRIKVKERRSFGIVVLSKTIIYTIIFFIISFFASWAGSGSLDLAKRYLLSTMMIGNFIFFVFAGFLFHFFKQMNKKFGPGIMFQYLTGKYFNPIEEDRIFMFLDLKSSTTIAEKLSHVRYSKFIQECFAELTDPVLKYKGQIYQFVGDEVVITWEKKDGLGNANCLKFYYDYINCLESKKAHFLKLYNVFPEFKAGLSLGLVTVAEVGELKTEIAYHGDVLNTAARIQGYCNEFDKQLLASETLVQELQENPDFVTHLVGEVELRGKEGISKIFSCEEVADDNGRNS
jgi:adenylate cyclase